MNTDPQAPLTEGELAAQFRRTLEALRFDLRPQITFGDHFNQAVVDGIDRLDDLCDIFWSRSLATARATGDHLATPAEAEAAMADQGECPNSEGCTYCKEFGCPRLEARRDMAEIAERHAPALVDAVRSVLPPDALDREVAVARELARLHFDRREWRGACAKAERTAWLVEKYWPQWRNDAASIIALLAPAPSEQATDALGREAVARIVDPEAWAAADDMGGGVITFDFQKPSLAKARSILNLICQKGMGE